MSTSQYQTNVLTGVLYIALFNGKWSAVSNAFKGLYFNSFCIHYAALTTCCLERERHENNSNNILLHSLSPVDDAVDS
jgi:hypothetical protein